jgi:putative DNA-invertase from lambdoid prophage Rac
MAVYGYCRVSTNKQVEEGESLAVQQRQIEGWCLMQGYDLTETFVESGVSASIPIASRPEGSRLMAKARKGDIIVTARLDRCFRSALDALQTVEAAHKKGFRIVVIDHLGDITGNGMAKAFLTIAAAFAELERESIKERVQTVKRDQRSRNRYLGGKVPYGYRVGNDGELVEEINEQAAIKYARELRAQGKPLRHIQRHLRMVVPGGLSLDTISRITK